MGFLVLPTGEGTRRNTEICQLNGAVFGGQDVGALDIAMDDTLVVEVMQTMKNLRHVDADQVFRKLAVGFANGMQGTIFAISGCQLIFSSQPFIPHWRVLLQDDVETVHRLHEADVLDNVVMLFTVSPLLPLSSWEIVRFLLHEDS